jgi:hypothetical protein
MTTGRGCSDVIIDYCSSVGMQMQLHLRNKNADVRLSLFGDVASQPAARGSRRPLIAVPRNVSSENKEFSSPRNVELRKRSKERRRPPHHETWSCEREEDIRRNEIPSRRSHNLL